jgi:glycosyltransferase involved in cell wall biosynthesis
VYGGAERALAPLTARLIAVSAAEANHARALGIAPSRIVTVPNGVDLPAAPSEGVRRQARARLGFGPDDQVLGFIGRLSAQKDPLRFCECIAIAQRRNPAVKGLIVGAGEGLESAKAHVAAAGLADSVVFTGWTDPAPLWPALDLFVMTSRYEAMPYTLLEALSHGVPILTTDVGGAAEAVDPDLTGVVVPTGATAAELAGEALKLIERPDGLASFRAASRVRARRFTIDGMVDATLAVYEGALRRSVVAHA